MKDTLATLDLTEKPGQRITTFRHIRHYQKDGPVETEPGERIFSSGPQHGFYSYTKETPMPPFTMLQQDANDKYIHDACIVDAKAGEPPGNWAWQSARTSAPPASYDKARLLDEAKATVAGRGKNYGTPEDNFGRIARHWSVYLRNRVPSTAGDAHIGPGDVAIMMSLMKIARLENDPKHVDSWVDLAGYAACGAEIETAP